MFIFTLVLNNSQYSFLPFISPNKKELLKNNSNSFDYLIQTIFSYSFRLVYAYHLIRFSFYSFQERIAVSFGTLNLMRSWYEKYEKYQAQVKECEKIKDVSQKAQALLDAEKEFDWWMDVYPEREVWKERLAIQKRHDQVMDFLGLNPKNPE